MANMFRLLNANEVDARVSTVKDNGVSLLLYKDARCDQNILDETVGPFNWKREHSRDNANCTVSLWDEVKGQWISKEDTGTESNTEKEKGLASDSFKRACFNWGIGRELYTAPFIWVSGDGQKLKYDRFTVKEIGYDSNREINKLKIVNRRNETVFEYTTRSEDLLPKETPADAVTAATKIDAPEWSPRKEAAMWAVKNGMTMQEFAEARNSLIENGQLADIPVKDLTKLQFDTLIDKVAVYRRAGQ